MLSETVFEYFFNLFQERMVGVPVGSGKFVAHGCDISKEVEVIRAFEWIKENVGPVQILINNAGICVPGGFTRRLFTITYLINCCISILNCIL